MLYVGPVRPFMGAWKERGLRRAADLAAELVALRVPMPVADVVTPVPPDAVRQLARGRHPAVELSTALGARWSLETADLLTRTGGARRQTGLGRAGRAGNVRGAFSVRGGVPARVVLVDDVYTTGATASAAANAPSAPVPPPSTLSRSRERSGSPHGQVARATHPETTRYTPASPRTPAATRSPL